MCTAMLISINIIDIIIIACIGRNRDAQTAVSTQSMGHRFTYVIACKPAHSHNSSPEGYT